MENEISSINSIISNLKADSGNFQIIWYNSETKYPDLTITKGSSTAIIDLPFIPPYDGTYIVSVSGSTQTDGGILSLSIGHDKVYALPRATCIGNASYVVSCNLTTIMQCTKNTTYNLYAHAEGRDLTLYDIQLSFIGFY